MANFKPSIGAVRNKSVVRNGPIYVGDADDSRERHEMASESTVAGSDTETPHAPDVKKADTKKISGQEAPLQVPPHIMELVEWKFRQGQPRGNGFIEQNLLRFGLRPKPLNKNERAAYAAAVRKAAQLYDARMTRINRELWLNDACNTVSACVDGVIQTWLPIGGVIYFSGYKGGVGKSSGAIALANKLAEKCEGGVLLLPIAANDGSTHVQAAVADEHTLNMVQLEQFLLELTADNQRANSKVLKSKLRYNANRVYVVAQESLPNDFGGKRLTWVLDQLKEVFQFIVLDGGNEVLRFDEHDKSLPEGGNTEYAAAQNADVIIVSAYTEVSNSFKGIGDTMKHFDLLEDKAKLARSIVVINGHRPSDSIDVWVKYAQNIVKERPDLGEKVNSLPYGFRVVGGEGKLILMPWSDRIRSSKTNDLTLFDEDGHFVLTELAYEVVLRIATQQKIDTERLHQILVADRQGFSNATPPTVPLLSTPTPQHDN